MIVQIETDLDVVAKQRQLVEEALSADSAYARLKENLELMLENSDIKSQDKAKVVADTLSQYAVSVTNSAMSIGLQWATHEKELAMKKEELQKQLDILAQNKLLLENQTATSLADRQLKQAQVIREYGVASVDTEGNITALDASGKEYASILNIQADTTNKSKQSEVLDANKSQTWAQTHKLVADTYVNHGVFTWTGVNANGVTGVNKASTGYTTLSDVQKQVAKQQALGYSMNAWGNAATSSAGMIGTLLAAEIPSMDAATIALYMNRWTTAVDKLNGSVAPEITL